MSFEARRKEAKRIESRQMNTKVGARTHRLGVGGGEVGQVLRRRGWLSLGRIRWCPVKGMEG